MNKLRYLVLAVTAVLAAAPAFPQSTVYMTEPSLSPDRKEIAFVSGGDIWTVPAEGGIARLLVSHSANESKPLFSPDGRFLAFGTNRTGNGDIYILDLGTGALRRLTFDDANDQIDAWSRDGKYVYFTSTARDIAGMGDILRVAATGGTPMQVSSDRYTAEFHASPTDDGTIVFAARGVAHGQWWRRGSSHIDESEIWTKTGANYTQLVKRGSRNVWPMATADGSRIFFMSDRGGDQNLWSVTRAGVEKQLTTFTDGRVLWPAMSYDGREIVFERNFGIWKMGTSGGKAERLNITLRGAASQPMTERVSLGTQLGEMELSPDGKKVAVIARGEVFAASSSTGGDAVRITNTPAAETYLAWTGDSRKLIYGSERSGGLNLYIYDFATETEQPLTTGNSVDSDPVLSPDGKSILFIRDARSLMVLDLASKATREVAKIFTSTEPILSPGDIVWSPDSKWIAYLTGSPASRSYTNVNVVPAAGGTARPVSFLANSFAGSLRWSPDGSYLLFATSQRTEDSQIARIDLKLRTPKFREDLFRELFREDPRNRPTQPAPSPTPAPSPLPSPSPAEKKEDAGTEIVFDDIRRRASLLTTGLNSGGVVISPDGKTAILTATAEGQFNLYTIALDELATDTSARQLTSTAGFKSQVQFSPDGKEVYYLENGRVNIVSLDRREVRPLNIGVDMNVDLAKEKIEVFEQGWRYMRDNFYDEKYHGVDWNAVHSTYRPLVESARTMEETRRIMNLMVGELNASHLGVGNPGNPPLTVGKLGLRFDRDEYEASGRLKITEVLPLGPAAVVKGINVGDYLVSVDGVRIGSGVNLDEILENKVNRRVPVSVSNSPDASNKRDFVVKPVNLTTEKGLVYRQWVESNRAYVDRVSGGKIGYVHLLNMTQAALNQLYIDLDAENQGKEGVVVDIRNNSGGFINPYVIDILSRKGYLTMRERGMWPVPARGGLGQRSLERPTVLVTNQHSLSDAEDLTEGYRTLKLGKVVGEPTSGWIIFTWDTALFDGTTFRLPRQLITGSDGKNMELNPRQVDVPVTRPIGETLTGRDSQLDRAVRELLGN